METLFLKLKSYNFVPFCIYEQTDFNINFSRHNIVVVFWLLNMLPNKIVLDKFEN